MPEPILIWITGDRVKLTHISLSLIPVQSFLSDSPGPTFVSPPPLISHPLLRLGKDSLQRGALPLE